MSDALLKYYAELFKGSPERGFLLAARHDEMFLGGSLFLRAGQTIHYINGATLRTPESCMDASRPVPS